MSTLIPFYNSLIQNRGCFFIETIHQENNENEYSLTLVPLIDSSNTNQLKTSLKISLIIEINRERLYNAYLHLPNRAIEYDFTKDEKKMNEFITKHGLGIMIHLETFNGIKDDYNEIAKLVDPIRGSIHATDYGI